MYRVFFCRCQGLRLKDFRALSGVTAQQMMMRKLRSGQSIALLAISGVVLLSTPVSSFMLPFTGRSASSPTMSLGKRSTAKEVVDHFSPDLKGKTAIVTGNQRRDTIPRHDGYSM
jgi:hypothetical protein